MIPTIGFLIALMPSVDSCAAYQKRAAALAAPKIADASEGVLEVSATKSTWYGGALTYAFLKTDSSKPVCAHQVVMLKHSGFTFDRGNDLAFEALEAVFDASIAEDFAKSKHVAHTKLPDQPVNVPMQWYRGKRFGYSTLTGSNAIVIMSLADFASELAQAQRNAPR